LRDALKDDDLFFFYKGVIQCYGDAMAEWQQQNSYSEADMREMYNKSCGLIGLGELNDQTKNNNRFRELINQIKNKKDVSKPI
jgi:hypothetical protein